MCHGAKFNLFDYFNYCQLESDIQLCPGSTISFKFRQYFLLNVFKDWKFFFKMNWEVEKQR